MKNFEKTSVINFHSVPNLLILVAKLTSHVKLLGVFLDSNLLMVIKSVLVKHSVLCHFSNEIYTWWERFNQPQLCICIWSIKIQCSFLGSSIWLEQSFLTQKHLFPRQILTFSSIYVLKCVTLRRNKNEFTTTFAPEPFFYFFLMPYQKGVKTYLSKKCLLNCNDANLYV